MTLQGAEVSASLEDALRLLAGPQHAGLVEHVFVIGGGQVYTEAIASPLCTAVHLTQVGHLLCTNRLCHPLRGNCLRKQCNRQLRSCRSPCALLHNGSAELGVPHAD